MRAVFPRMEPQKPAKPDVQKLVRDLLAAAERERQAAAAAATPVSAPKKK